MADLNSLLDPRAQPQFNALDLLTPGAQAPAPSPNPAASIAQPLDNGPTPTVDPYAPANATGGFVDSFARGLRRSVQNIGPELTSAKGAVQTAFGDTADGLPNLRRAQADMAFNDQRGPQTDSFAAAQKSGDWSGYIGGKLGGIAPDAAMALIPGAAAGVLGRSLARRGVLAAAEEIGARASERALAAGATEDAAAQVATKATAKATGRLATQTDAAGDVGSHIGNAVGATVGTEPGTIAGHNDDITDQGSALKALAGSTVEAAIGSLPAVRALNKVGAGPEVTQGIAKVTEKFLPKVAKATAREGALMAGLSVPQTAAALATHGWVKDNIDLLPPGALETYLDGAISGGLMGAAFGGGAEAIHSAVRPDFSGAANLTGKFTDAMKSRLDKFKQAGTPVDDLPPDQRPKGDLHPQAIDAYQSVSNGLTAPDAKKAFSTAFSDNYNSNKEQFKADPLSAKVQTTIDALRQAVTDTKSPEGKAQLTKMLADHLSGMADENVTSSSFDDFEKHAENITLESPQGHADDALETPQSVTDRHIDQAPIEGKSARDTVPTDMGSPIKNQIASLIPDDHIAWKHPTDVKEMTDSVYKTFNGEDPDAGDKANVSKFGQIIGQDRLSKILQLGPEWHELDEVHDQVDKTNVEPTHTELAQKVVDTAGTPDHEQAQSDLKSALLKTGAVFTENQSSPKARAAWNEKEPSTHANTIEIEPKVINERGDTRRQALQVDNLVNRQLAETPGIGPHAALSEALGNLHLAGIKVKPESITPGVFWKSKDGTSEARLTPAQVKSAREGVKVQVERGPTPKPDASVVAENRKGINADKSRISEGERTEKTNGEVAIKSEDERHKLVPRREPPKDQSVVGKNGRDAPALNDEPIKPEALRAETADVLQKAGKNLLGTKRTVSEKELRNSAKEIAAKLKANVPISKEETSPLTKAERMFYNAARDAGYIKSEADASGVDPKDAVPRGIDATEGKLAKADAEERSKTHADDDVAAGFHEATKDEGPHDHVAETRMLNALLSKLGIKDLPVKVVPAAHDAPGGNYDPNTHIIRINPNLHGAERIDVLAHELGHHVVFSELGHNLERATPELRDALIKDHEAWKDEQNNARAKVSDVLASRKPYFRGEAIKPRSDGTTVGELAAHSAKNFGYLYEMHEYLADHIARALTQSEEGQGVIGKFFKGLADKLKTVYDHLFSSKDGEQFKPAKSVDVWIKDLFDRNRSDVSQALDEGVTAQYARESTRAAFDAAMGSKEPGEKVSGRPFRSFARFVDKYLNDGEKKILMRALDRGVVERKLRAQYGHDKTMIQLLESPARRTSALIYLAEKEFRAGRLNLGPAAEEPIRSIGNALHKVLGVAGANEFSLRMMQDFQDIQKTRDASNTYDVRAKEAAERGTAQKVVNIGTAIGRSVMEATRPLLWGALDRVHMSNIPSLRKIGGLVKLYSSEPGKDQQHDMMTARLGTTQSFIDKSSKLVKDLSPAESKAMLDHLQQAITTPHADPKIDAAVNGMRALMREGHTYGTKAGIGMGDAGKHYFPVTIDGSDVTKRAGDFKALLAQPKFEQAMRDKLKDTKSTLPELAAKLHTIALDGQGNDGSTDAMAPSFSAKNTRLMDFIYKHGDADDIKKFASFQKKDPADILGHYFEGLTNRAEFARRFGEKGERLSMMLDRAKKQGASDKDIQLTRDMVNSATGHYGGGKSPLLASIFGADVAGKIYGKNAAKVADGLMTYQNVRVLPLALLSSIVDPLGIFVRSGGDFRGGFKSFKAGLSALNEKNPSHVRELAQALSIAEDYMNLDGLRNGYGGSDSSTLSRRINDTVFKLNGLTKWTKATRYMATGVAEQFLLRHATETEKHSSRYLMELGVKAMDIHSDGQGRIKLLSEAERTTATKSELASDNRVRKAMTRFVEQSILRTDASQHPVYMNDPVARVFSQYKQFAYAFEQQIIERAFHEIKYYQNYKVLAPFLAYVPVTIAAEMVRGLAQFGPGGNPNRDDWGPQQYAAFGAQRAGIFGPKAEYGINALEGKQYGSMLGFSARDFGPTASQAAEIGSTLVGHHSASSTLVDALPASPLIKHHLGVSSGRSSSNASSAGSDDSDGAS